MISGAVNAIIMARVPARSWLWENGSYAYAWDWTSGEERCDPIADIISNDEVHICRTHLRTKYLCAQNVHLYIFIEFIVKRCIFDPYVAVFWFSPYYPCTCTFVHGRVVKRIISLNQCGKWHSRSWCRFLLVMAAVYILVWNRQYVSHNVEAHHSWVCWPWALRTKKTNIQHAGSVHNVMSLLFS